MSGSTPAVFLDRDGVLNVYLPGAYVRNGEELVLLPGVAAAVAELNALDVPVVLISNQQGVAKGLMTADDLQGLDVLLKERLRDEAGARLDASYYCPHHARENCACRKPLPGMLLQAAREHGIDLARSVFIGDTVTDAAAARAAGVGAFVLVLTGKLRDAADAADPALFPTSPDYVAATLADAVPWVRSYLGHSGERVAAPVVAP
jgi:histidinol-phosphate phosphatase family domain/HAD-superfamily hydrolase, subfamily IIIA